MSLTISLFCSLIFNSISLRTASIIDCKAATSDAPLILFVKSDGDDEKEEDEEGDESDDNDDIDEGADCVILTEGNRNDEKPFQA